MGSELGQRALTLQHPSRTANSQIFLTMSPTQPNHNDTNIVEEILTSFLNRKRIRINSRLSIRIFLIASFNLWQARARTIIWLAKPKLRRCHLKNRSINHVSLLTVLYLPCQLTCHYRWSFLASHIALYTGLYWPVSWHTLHVVLTW